MDPPENSVNRFGRTIWTVWGYLSGAVAKYLRPEVTAEGNQSVCATTEDTALKNAVNKIDREVKINKSDNENDRAEVESSSCQVRAAASVQWENTGVVSDDNNDKLHVSKTEKQTYHCAAWSTGTETDREGHAAQKAPSDEVQTEEEHANRENEERETSQELEITGKTEQKDDYNKEECEENHEDEMCAEKRGDTDNRDLISQSERDVEQDKQIIVMDRRETEDTGGLKQAEEHVSLFQYQDIVQKNQEKPEDDEDQVTESQVQGLLEYLADEANNINELSKSGVEEVMLGSEQKTTEREHDMIKYKLKESPETLQRESESHAPNDEEELKMTTVAVETIEALGNTLLMDSSENAPESGTGSSVLASKTVCEVPGEPGKGLEADWACFEEIQSKLHDPQTPAEEQAERDSDETQHDTEALIQTDRTELSLKEHEFRAELTVETTETKMGSEDEEAEALETESRSPVIRNVTLQTHQLLEFTEKQYRSSQGTMETFSETQEIVNMSETYGSEDLADARPVSTRSLSPTELLEEHQDVEKTALEFVEEITNQVLKEMIDTETELLVELSAEDQAPEQCVSADASVLEEEQRLLPVDCSEERISSADCEGPKADGRHEPMQKSTAGETLSRSHEDLMEVSRSGMKRAFDLVSADRPETKTEGRFDLILKTFEDSSLDFSVQKCRIAVKNPLVRPPKDPRKLLFRASVEPLGQTLRGSAPNKALIGFKLPGLGAGLRKTEFGKKTEAERTLQPESVTEDSVKQEVPVKAKWTPPRHPGMGSPFMMAELKNKLKKPVQE
ncbi:uncharacterized protein si:ch211-136m16.8 [Puntigrus tetrazona]|uniref:uncharacterized protein si:ch211-136m16.8 n=1 Tax=Puntigrus tetrazona TaxID=1606681 RepID=UPI001C8AC921|nr:uncharacterized protein si:ch211-136m16.8 [Puntigrus tetrazona]